MPQVQHAAGEGLQQALFSNSVGKVLEKEVFSILGQPANNVPWAGLYLSFSV